MSNSPTPLDSEALTLCRELAGHTFPWGINRALELALLKRQPGLARPQRSMHFYSQQPTRSDGAPGAAGPAESTGASQWSNATNQQNVCKHQRH